MGPTPWQSPWPDIEIVVEVFTSIVRVVLDYNYLTFHSITVATFGFNPITYGGEEGDEVMVTVELMEGTLEREVVLNVQSSDGTAEGTHQRLLVQCSI